MNRDLNPFEPPTERAQRHHTGRTFGPSAGLVARLGGTLVDRILLLGATLLVQRCLVA